MLGGCIVGGEVVSMTRIAAGAAAPEPAEANRFQHCS